MSVARRGLPYFAVGGKDWQKQILLNLFFTTAIAFFLKAIGAGGTIYQNLVMSYCIGFGIPLFSSLFLFLGSGGNGFFQFALVAAGVVSGILAGSWLGYSIIGVSPSRLDLSEWQTTFAIGLMFGLIGSLFFYSRWRVLRAEAVAREAELAQTQRDKLLTEAGLKLLQAQIEPHFLYNTLATVHSLVDSRPDAAKSMLEDLNNYLRVSLVRSREEKGTVWQELEMLRAYLSIMKVRMGERMSFEIDCPDDLKDFIFQPMLLQPLVENAVKHGLEPKVDGGAIRISISKKGQMVRAEVADTGGGFEDAGREGVGLSNVRARLKAIYGDLATLEIITKPGGGTTAVLGLPGAE